MTRTTAARHPWLDVWRWPVLALLTAIGACSHQAPTELMDVSGLLPALELTLTADSGEMVHAGDFHGQIVLLYFGYTHCPDVCPTTLTRLSQVLKKLGPAASKIRVLFVSVDPARDTPQVLSQYVKAFGPRFVGLQGSDEALQALTKRYRVTYGRDKPDSHGDYEVFHSSAVFVFDGEGKARLLIGPSDTSAAIEHDLRQLAEDRLG